MSVGIAFSGGGVKAAFHIGVLRAFEEHNINVDFVSGTSSGAIVASLFAAGFSSSDILNLFNHYAKKVICVDNRSIFKGVMNIKKGVRCINKFDNLEWILHSVFKSKGIFDINDVSKKLAVCSVDVNLGKIIYFVNCNNMYNCDEEIYMCRGALYKMVRASSAYPIIFEPSFYKGRILVDGGVMNNLPVRILKKMGANNVIAVDVSNKCTSLKNLSMIDIGLRCIDIMGKYSKQKEIEEADFVIIPNNISNISILDFDYINVLANQGYYETKKVINTFKF